MSHGSELKSPGAQALRAAGYKPLPRLWVTQEQMDLVQWWASQNAAEVNRIRREAQMTTTKARYGARPVAKLYAEINDLRRAIRAAGTPRIQDAWDKVEEHIDIAYTAAAKEPHT